VRSWPVPASRPDPELEKTMPIRGILNTAHALSYLMHKQALTANNLSNSDTDGFKADYMAATLLPGIGFPVAATRTDFNQGALNTTGRSLDIALEGPGFFVVQTPAGERLTRGGSLMLDGDNRLARDGHLLLGQRGPIAVPAKTAKLEVHADGAVVADGVELDRLRMEDVADHAQLLKEGAGLYVPQSKTSPVSSTDTVVRQGAVEESNLDTIHGMVDLVEIQRAYAMNVDALKAMDGVLGNVVNEVGKA
jgi:flagellar basal-body rod protein FlgG